MADSIKTIGILTSGGDAPGMNAAIRAVCRKALVNGLKVKGIERGYTGLLHEEIFDMDKKSVSDIIQALVIVFSVAGMALTKLPEFEAFRLRLSGALSKRKEVQSA